MPNEPNETRPPEGFETWLDYALFLANGYDGARPASRARAELANLRARCELFRGLLAEVVLVPPRSRKHGDEWRPLRERIATALGNAQEAT